MNTQQILARVHDAMQPYEAIVNAADSRSYSAESVASDMRDRLANLAADLEAQVRNEIAASKGVGSALKAMNAVLNKDDPRECLRYPWIDAEGRQCVCDGFQAYRLREHLPLIERPDDAGTPIDLEKIIPSNLDGWKELTPPAAKELRAFIAVERAKQGGRRKDFVALWSFGDDAPTVNAQYLLNAVTIFPDMRLFWNTLVSPLVIVSERGDGVVLPIRTTKTQAKPATDAERRAIEREQQERERHHREIAEEAKARLQARRDADAAWDDVHAAQKAQLNAMDRMSKAGAAESDADKNAYLDACEAEAKARLRHYAATIVFDERHSMTPEEFENIVRKLYRHDAA